MNKALRKAVIAGNWKMNNTPAETTALLEEMKPLVADADCDESSVHPLWICRLPWTPPKAPTFRWALRTATGQRKVLSLLRCPLPC